MRNRKHETKEYLDEPEAFDDQGQETEDETEGATYEKRIECAKQGSDR